MPSSTSKPAATADSRLFLQTPSSPAGFQQMSDTSGSFTGFAHASERNDRTGADRIRFAGFSADSGQRYGFSADSAERVRRLLPRQNQVLDIAEELKIYKELLDSEIITQEESDAKKKQLLNL